jgi:hypothetical protein
MIDYRMNKPGGLQRLDSRPPRRRAHPMLGRPARALPCSSSGNPPSLLLPLLFPPLPPFLHTLTLPLTINPHFLPHPLPLPKCGHSGTTELINIRDRHPLVHAYRPRHGVRRAAQILLIPLHNPPGDFAGGRSAVAVAVGAVLCVVGRVGKERETGRVRCREVRDGERCALTALLITQLPPAVRVSARRPLFRARGATPQGLAALGGKRAGGMGRLDFSVYCRLPTTPPPPQVKSPSNICRLGYILKFLPSARVVLMVRDGRCSPSKRGSRELNYLHMTAAYFWQLCFTTESTRRVQTSASEVNLTPPLSQPAPENMDKILISVLT